MTTVYASCQTCGAMTIKPRAIVVHVCVTTGNRHYSFRCPVCSMNEARPVDPKIASRLLAAGAHLRSWRMPAELDELHTGPPLTLNDVLDLHLALRDPSWVDRLSLSGDS